MRSARMRLHGFTLIEVLVAVLVLALSLGVMVQSGAHHARSAEYLRERTLALFVAHNRLTEIQLDPAWPANGKSNDDVSMGGQQWRWRVKVQDTGDQTLRRIDIDVVPTSTPDASASYASLSTFLSNVGRLQQ